MPSVYIPKDEYRKVHFYQYNNFKITTDDGRVGYWYDTADESNMLIEEAQYAAVKTKPVNAGNVGPVNTSNTDFKPCRYNVCPYTGVYYTSDGDRYIRARENGITFEVVEAPQP